jgi:hypothetical protein
VLSHFAPWIVLQIPTNTTASHALPAWVRQAAGIVCLISGVAVEAVGPAEVVVVAPAVEAFVVVQRAHIAADNASRDRAGPITARAFANRSAEPVARN